MQQAMLQLSNSSSNRAEPRKEAEQCMEGVGDVVAECSAGRSQCLELELKQAPSKREPQVETSEIVIFTAQIHSRVHTIAQRTKTRWRGTKKRRE